jgi:hypothetical protein
MKFVNKKNRTILLFAYNNMIMPPAFFTWRENLSLG